MLICDLNDPSSSRGPIFFLLRWWSTRTNTDSGEMDGGELLPQDYLVVTCRSWWGVWIPGKIKPSSENLLCWVDRHRRVQSMHLLLGLEVLKGRRTES